MDARARRFLDAARGVEAFIEDESAHPAQVVKDISAIKNAEMFYLRFADEAGRIWDIREKAFSDFAPKVAWHETEARPSPEELEAWLNTLSTD
ncbi:MAG: hypothetical protein R8K47_01875 [Mariprofundaceae bacterium]